MGDRLSLRSCCVDCSRLDTRLDTSTSFPSRPASVALRWLLASCTVQRSVSAMMHTASAMGSSRTGCCGRHQRVCVTHSQPSRRWQPCYLPVDPKLVSTPRRRYFGPSFRAE